MSTGGQKRGADVEEEQQPKAKRQKVEEPPVLDHVQILPTVVVGKTRTELLTTYKDAKDILQQHGLSTKKNGAAWTYLRRLFVKHFGQSPSQFFPKKLSLRSAVAAGAAAGSEVEGGGIASTADASDGCLRW